MSDSPPASAPDKTHGQPVSIRAAACLAFPIIGLGLLLVAFAVVLWINSNVESKEDEIGRPRVGRVMADFSLNDLNGIKVRLSDYKGRPVLINFWATWCPPCVQEMPLLVKAYQKNQEAGLVILAVDVGEPRNLVEKVANDLNLPFPVLLDSDQAFADALRIHAFPTSVLIGRDGIIKKVHVGSYTPREIERDILSILESK